MLVVVVEKCPMAWSREKGPKGANNIAAAKAFRGKQRRWVDGCLIAFLGSKIDPKLHKISYP